MSHGSRSRRLHCSRRLEGTLAPLRAKRKRGLVLTRSCVTQAYTAVANAMKLELKHDA
ncbi:hypothetical protein MPC4_240020 [Methylocella tundrae]|uniref:Uncharacterized protein n=1 Tax=Methylocella tundrae TaxID=227605 RepID=A0A8B6M7P0_METTU|nr:hypothetical protein MPC1_6160002 [Methylocella tundrae]VTZ50441.1 hypothetical protein MPC4_240020 [Methylocella tundrae]